MFRGSRVIYLLVIGTLLLSGIFWYFTKATDAFDSFNSYEEDFSTIGYFDAANSDGVWDTVSNEARLPYLGWTNPAASDDFSLRSLNGSCASEPCVEDHMFVLDSNDLPHVVWVQEGDLYYARWDNTAKAWTDAAMSAPGTSDNLSSMITAPMFGAFEPHIVLNSSDEPYVVWLADADSDPFNKKGVVYFTRWDSADMRWETLAGTPGVENRTSLTSRADDVSIALNSVQDPYVAWSGPGVPFSDIFFEAGNGSSWNGAINVSNTGTTNTSLTPQFVVDGSDNVGLIWAEHLFNDTGSNIKFSFGQYSLGSVSFGSTEDLTSYIASDPEKLALNFELKLESLSDTFHVAYAEIGVGSFNLKYRKRAAGALGTFDPIEDIETGIVEDPMVRLTVDSQGKPQVLWSESSQLYYGRRDVGWAGTNGIPGVFDVIDDGLQASHYHIVTDSSDRPVVLFEGGDFYNAENRTGMYLTRFNGNDWTHADLMTTGAERITAATDSATVGFNEYTPKYTNVLFSSVNDRIHVIDVEGETGGGNPQYLYYRQYRDDRYYAGTSTIQSSDISAGGSQVVEARLTYVDDLRHGGQLWFYLSNNGTTWHRVDEGDRIRFPEVGDKLYWRVKIEGDYPALDTPLIKRIAIQYNFDSTAPTAPSLIGPAEGATVDETPTVTFTANDGDTYCMNFQDYPALGCDVSERKEDGIRYEVEFHNLNEDSDLAGSRTLLFRADPTKDLRGWSDDRFHDTGDVVRYSVPEPRSFMAGATIYWRVRAVDRYGRHSDWSSTRSFIVASSVGQEVTDRYFYMKEGPSYLDNKQSLVDYRFSSADVRPARNGNVVTIPASNTFASAEVALSDGGFSGEGYDIDYGDIDFDGDLDVVIQENDISKLYKNDGTGTFIFNSAFGAGTPGGIKISGPGVLIGHQDDDFEMYVYSSNTDEMTLMPVGMYLGYIPDEEIPTEEIDGIGLIPSDSKEFELADLDGDGYNEIIIASATGGVKILPWDLQLDSAFDTRDVLVFDANNDGLLDILEVNDTDPSQMHINNGDHTFTTSTDFTTSTYGLGEAVAYDFDSDGDEDYFVPTEDTEIFINDNQATGLKKVISDTIIDECDGSILVSDIDNDGDGDILCGDDNADFGDSGERFIFRNLGNNTFAAPELMTGIGSAQRMVAADFDGDGDNDVIVVSPDAHDNRYYENTVAGRWSMSTMPADRTVQAVFDSDNDGDYDLYVENQDSGANELWVNDGTQNYTVRAIFSSSAAPVHDVLAVDLNNDDYVDIIEAFYDGTTVVNINTPGTNTFVPGVMVGQSPLLVHSVSTLDVNNDGYIDLVTATEGGGDELFLNDGSGTFTKVTNPFNINSTDAEAVVGGDFTNDGLDDILFGFSAAPGASSLVLYKNKGDNTFEEIELATESSSIYGLHSVDFDHDGDLDIVYENDGRNLNIALNNGAGFFSDTLEFTVSSMLDFNAQDINDDGWVDIMVAQDGLNTVFINQGELRFVATDSIMSTAAFSYKMLAADYDIDGDTDIFVSNLGAASERYDLQQWHASGGAEIQSTNLVPSDEAADLLHVLSGATVMGDFSANSETLDYYASSFRFPIRSTATGTNSTFHALGVNYSGGDYETVALAGEDGTVVISYDSGETFYDISPPGETRMINLVQPDTGSVYVAGDDGLVLWGTLDAMPDQYSWVDRSWATADFTYIGAGDASDALYALTRTGEVYACTNDIPACPVWTPYVATDVQLNDMWAFDPGIVIAVGNDGRIIKSIDYGAHWNVIASGTTDNINTLSCTTPSDCTAFGDNGLALVSDDGGNTWTIAETYTNADMYDSIGDKAVGSGGTFAVVSPGAGPPDYVAQGFVVNDDQPTWYGVYQDDPFGIIHMAGSYGAYMTMFTENTSPVFSGPVTPNVPFSFDVGPDLYWKAQLDTADLYTTPVIRSVTMAYTYKPTRPQNVTPVDGAVDVPTDGVTLNADPFESFDNDTHVSSTWQVSLLPDNFTTGLVYEAVDSPDLESHTIPSGTLTDGTTYFWRVKYTDSTGDESAYSASTIFSTSGQSSVGGSGGGGVDGILDTPPLAPTIDKPVAISPSAIEWYFNDNAVNEDGFELRVAGVKVVDDPTANSNKLTETGLEPNTLYTDRRVYAYNSQGYSPASAKANPTFTLAAVPSISAQPLSATSIQLTVSGESNPAVTAIAIYESSTGLYVQADGSMSTSPVWQTESDWGTVVVESLTPETMYTFQAKARNQSWVETAFSAESSATTTGLGEANVVLSKSVLINGGVVASTGFSFGLTALAAESDSTFVQMLPVYINFMDVLMLVGLILLIAFVLAVVINAKNKFKNKYKYASHVVFKDIFFKKPAAIHVLLSEDKAMNTRAYTDHQKYYKWVGHSFWSLLAVLIMKGLVLGLLGLLVYSSVPQFVSADDNGLPVMIGDVMTYSLKYQNSGALFVSGVTITDSVPEGTSYRAGSLVLNGVSVSDADDGDSGTYLSGSDMVSFTLPDLEIGASGTASFKVTVVGAEGTSIANSANLNTETPVFISDSNTTINVVGDVLPVVPAEPVEPVVPEEPAESVVLEEPTEPVVPVGPEEPAEPVAPAEPEEPIEPAVPVGPEEPAEPVVPVVPEEPVAPVVPNVPTEPDNPAGLGDATDTAHSPSSVGESVDAILHEASVSEEYLKDLNDQIKNIDEQLSYSDIVGAERLALITEKTWLQTQAAAITVADTAVKGVKIFNTVTLDNPVVEEVNDVVKNGVITATVITNVAVITGATTTLAAGAATSVSFLAYLQFFMAQPLLFIGRKRRKQWGTVYDSITKKPISLAIVRLFNVKTNKLELTRVTDKAGRYNFIIDPGEYKIEITKVGYKFPSEILAGVSEDKQFVNLYHGDTIVVTEKKVLNFNIGVDPNNVPLPAHKEIRKFSWIKWQYGFAMIGPIVAGISFAITPKLWVFGIFIMQIFMFYMFKKMAVPPKVDNWGVVANSESGGPLKNVIVRIFDTKFNKLLETQVTDKAGRYGFLVGQNEYLVTGEKKGFERYTSEPIPIEAENGGIVNPDIKMAAVK